MSFCWDISKIYLDMVIRCEFNLLKILGKYYQSKLKNTNYSMIFALYCKYQLIKKFSMLY